MELYEYLRIIRRRWWLILLVVAIGAGTAFYFLSQQPPRYESRATLLLSPSLTREALLGEANARIGTAVLAQTYARYLETRAFAEMVVEAEGLPVSANEFSGAVEANLVQGTLFFEISAVSENPELAQQLASAASNYFVQEVVRQQQEIQRLRETATKLDSGQALLQETLANERSYYEASIPRLREELDGLMGETPSAERDSAISALQRRLSEQEDRLLRILSDQVALADSPADTSTVDTVTIVEEATLPTRPLDSGAASSLLFTIASTAVLGLALAFGLEYLDFTIKSPEDLEAMYGAPTLGVLRAMGRDASSRNLVVLDDPRGSIAEAFRVLRTNLQFSSPETPLRSLVVTSAGPSEGKTLTSTNLALVMAQAGRTVILVDADLRRPSVHKRLNLSNEKGFTSLLVADHPDDPDVIAEHLQPGPHEHMFVLTSGPIPPNPAELLSMVRTRALASMLTTLADIVIFDTPPVATVTDAAILASFVDGTLHVVAAGQIRRDLVLKARDTLRRVEANVLGPVLNRVQQQDIGSYYYYYYYGSNYTNDSPTDGEGASDRQLKPRTNPSFVTRLRRLLPGSATE
ncbi:MAG: polysaccharide biosynthesis tyrosine autokinase [Ardenticatenales bacterium]|nr:polysaccharide biosynthesis tyrosine autokinase [Ardenticatenales bacterium]